MEEQGRLNMSLLNHDGGLSCLRLIPVNTGADVRTTFLRAAGRFTLRNSKHLTPSVLRG